MSPPEVKERGSLRTFTCQKFQGTARAVYHLGSDLFVVLLQEPRPHALWDVRDTHRDPFSSLRCGTCPVVPRPPVGGDVIQGTAAGNEVQAGMDSCGSRGILCRRTDAPASHPTSGTGFIGYPLGLTCR